MISGQLLKSSIRSHLLSQNTDELTVRFDVTAQHPASPADMTEGKGRVVLTGPIGDYALRKYVSQNLAKLHIMHTCYAIEEGNAGWLMEQVAEIIRTTSASTFPKMKGQYLVYSNLILLTGPTFNPKFNIYSARADGLYTIRSFS